MKTCSVRLCKPLCWRVEMFYENNKQSVGCHYSQGVNKREKVKQISPLLSFKELR